MLKIITILLSFFLMTTEIKAQNDNALTSQILGTWLVKDLDLELREEYKNDAEAQKMLATMRNRQKTQQTITMFANHVAFTFMENGQMWVHLFDMQEKMEATWQLRENLIEMKAGGSPIESALNPSKPVFKDKKLYLGLLSGNGVPKEFEKYLTYFVCEKITEKELETLASQTPTMSIPEETVYIIDKETWTVASKKAKCNIEGATSCLQIKKNDSNDWIYLPDTIEGFEYKEGFEYTIEVVANYNAANPNGQYKLLKLIQKKKKKKR